MRSKTNSVVATSFGVAIATGLYGISFGALAVSAGLEVWQAMLLSLLMFSGGSQFAFIGVLASGGGVAFTAAIVGAWLLGVRNGFYAVSMAPILQKNGWSKIVAAQLTIDESTAVSQAQPSLTEQRRGFWLTGSLIYLFWNLATLMGALLGDALGDPAAWGLDAAAAAAFLGLVWPRLKGSKAFITAGSALVLATAFSPIVDPGVSILIAGVAAFVVGWREK